MWKPTKAKMAAKQLSRPRHRAQAIGTVFLSLLLLLGSSGLSLADKGWDLLQAAQRATASGDPSQESTGYSNLLNYLYGQPPTTNVVTEEATYEQKLGRVELQTGDYDKAYAEFQLEVTHYDAIGLPDSEKDDRRIGEQIAPVAQVYVRRPVSLAPVADQTGARLEPAYGAYIGGAFDRDPRVGPDFSETTALLGKRQAVANIYVATWGQPLNPLLLQGIRKAGVAIQVALSPTADQGLGVVQDDSYTEGFLKTLASLNVPVFLRFDQEFNLSGNPGYADPPSYIAKFRLLADLAHRLAPNVAMVWAPNVVPTEHLTDYYPGDQYVDWVGVDLYTDYYFLGDPTQPLWMNAYYREGQLATPIKQLAPIYAMFQKTKPIMISEWAVDVEKSGGVPNAPWDQNVLKTFYAYLPMLYPRVKGVFYFDNAPTTQEDYNLADDPTLSQDLAQSLQDDWYLSQVGQSTGPTERWAPLGEVTLGGPETITAYVNIPGDPFVTSVRYLLNGKLIGQATSLPFELNYDFGSITQPEELTVTAEGQSGRSLTQSFTLVPQSYQVFLNGQRLDFDAPPILAGGHIMVPVRYLARALGGHSHWSAPNGVEIDLPGKTVVMQIGQPAAEVNGQPVDFGAPSMVSQNRTMVPIRFVAQVLGLKVAWDSAGERVLITTN